MGDLFKGYEKHRIKVLKTVLGDDLPDWIPDGDVMLINRAISEFLGQGFPPDEVGGWVCEDTDVPMERLSPILTQHLFYLLKVKRALIQGERQGIPLLIGGKQTHRIVKLTRKAKDSKGGKRKLGHKGPLKHYIREVMDDGANNFDAVLAALEAHIMVDDVTDKMLTYASPNGKLKDVKISAVKKAYREIISSL